jgi:hypothetical protein
VALPSLLAGACFPPTAVPAPYWAFKTAEKIKIAASPAIGVLKILTIFILAMRCRFNAQTSEAASIPVWPLPYHKLIYYWYREFTQLS